MQFLIDLENVHSAGLRGSELLTEADTVVLFYSDSNEKIEQGALNRIFNSGCNIVLRKVKTKGKNALDFYIAAYVGELLGKGSAEYVSIVSNDKDFQMVREYWMTVRPKSNIALKPNIISCIIASQERGKRVNRALYELRGIPLKEAYASRQREAQQKKELQEMIGTEKVEDAIALLQQGLSGRALYLAVLKLLGRENGLRLYRYIKEKAEGSIVSEGNL